VLATLVPVPWHRRGTSLGGKLNPATNDAASGANVVLVELVIARLGGAMAVARRRATLNEVPVAANPAVVAPVVAVFRVGEGALVVRCAVAPDLELEAPHLSSCVTAVQVFVVTVKADAGRMAFRLAGARVRRVVRLAIQPAWKASEVLPGTVARLDLKVLSEPAVAV